MKKLLTIKEVAQLTGYKESYVRKLISQGVIEKTKLRTGGVRISVEALKAWVGDVYEI